MPGALHRRSKPFLTSRSKRKPVVYNIEVSRRLPVGKEASQVSVLLPDEEVAQKVPFGVESQRVNVTAPKVQIYDLVVVRMEPGLQLLRIT